MSGNKECPECRGKGNLEICVCCGQIKCEADGIEPVTYQNSICFKCKGTGILKDDQ